MLNFLRKQMKLVMVIIVVAFLFSTFLMYEGRSARRSPRRNSDGSMADYEVAKINGRSLMRSELERRLRDYLSNYSSRSAESLDMPAIYQAVLNQAVLESQLAREVEEKGVRVSDADADRAMKEYADRYYPTRETFYQALANSGVKLDDYRRSLARRMATEQVIRDAIGEVTISDDRVLEFYDTMKYLIYSSPEGYRLHMADFNTSADADFLRSKLLAGESWEEIVSKDELASHDVVNITRETVFLPMTAFSVAPFTMLASLDVGTVSPVFAVTSFDYAVGLKTEYVSASVRPYDEVSGDIKTMLTTQEERRRLTEYEAGLRNKAQLVINDAELFARPAVSEDEVPAVEDVIPELAETEKASEPETPAQTEEPASEPETSAVVEETVTVTEEAKPETDEKPELEAPAVVEETVTVTEEAKPADEKLELEAPSVVEEVKDDSDTPEAVEEVKSEIEAPVTVEDVQSEAEAPAVVEEAASIVEEIKSEAPAVVEAVVSAVEEAKPEIETPAVVEGIIAEETPAVVEEVITSTEPAPAE